MASRLNLLYIAMHCIVGTVYYIFELKPKPNSSVRFTIFEENFIPQFVDRISENVAYNNPPRLNFPGAPIWSNLFAPYWSKQTARRDNQP